MTLLCHIWSQVLTLGYDLLRLSLPLPSPWIRRPSPHLVSLPQRCQRQRHLSLSFTRQWKWLEGRGDKATVCAFSPRPGWSILTPVSAPWLPSLLEWSLSWVAPPRILVFFPPTSSLIFLTHRIESRMDSQEVCLESWPWQPTPNCSHPQEGIILRLLCSHIRPLGAGQAQLQEDYQFPK